MTDKIGIDGDSTGGVEMGMQFDNDETVFVGAFNREFSYKT